MISTALRMENPVKSPIVPPINPRAASVVTLITNDDMDGDKYSMMIVDHMVSPIQGFLIDYLHIFFNFIKSSCR